MTFPELLAKIEGQCRSLVWWSPDQIERGEHLGEHTGKGLPGRQAGERAWAVPRKTGQFLHDFVTEHQPRVILELGTSIGYSTAWMAHAASSYGGHVHSVEIRKYKYQVAEQNIKDGGLEKNVTLYNAKIMDVITHLDAHLADMKINLVFMDADRGHYHEYFPIIEPYLAPNAAIIADNAINMRARMQPFLDLLESKGWHMEIIDMDNGVLVAKAK